MIIYYNPTKENVKTMKKILNRLSAIKITFSGLKSTDAFKICEEQIQGWPKEIDDLSKGDHLLNYRTSVDPEYETLRYQILYQDVDDETLAQQIQKKMYTSSEEKIKKEISRTRALITPDKAYDIITAPFRNEGAKTICKNYLYALHNAEYRGFHHLIFAFRNGVRRFSELPQKFMPKETSTKLIKFMTTDQVFLAFFKAHEILAKRYKETYRDNWQIPSGLSDFVINAPANERDEILELMGNIPLFRTAIGNATGFYISSINKSPKELRKAIEDKNAILKTVENHPFFKHVISTGKAGMLTIYLARGLSPEDFDGMLHHTRMFADKEQGPGATIENAQSTINDIAVEAMLLSQPELYKTAEAQKIIDSSDKPEGMGVYPPIDMVCGDQKATWRYKNDATEIMKIAFSHCKKPPNYELITIRE